MPKLLASRCRNGPQPVPMRAKWRIRVGRIQALEPGEGRGVSDYELGRRRARSARDQHERLSD